MILDAAAADAADPHAQQRRIDLVVVGVGVGRLVVEDHEEVEIAIGPGPPFRSASEEIDPERLQRRSQAIKDCLERACFRRKRRMPMTEPRKAVTEISRSGSQGG